MSQRVIIIAEAGVNHNGDINRAKALIDAASDAGVDFVKFQTFKAASIVSPDARKADYQIKNTNDAEASQFDMLQKLELTDDDHQELIRYCEQKGIHFFSTAFDVEGIKYLNSLGFTFFKVPSGEITNYPYLKEIAKTKKPVILSTGMATMTEVEWAVNVLTKFGTLKEDITILHCNTEYPTPMEDVNLKAMLTIERELGVNVGYSDHTLGIEVPVAAVALGATVIEKHFTMDRNLPGPDHKASLEPDELEAMVTSIRNIEKAISGSATKEPSQSEIKNKVIARKSIHIKTALQEGSILTEEDIISLRPGDGISTTHWEEIVGKQLRRDVASFYKLKWEDLHED